MGHVKTFRAPGRVNLIGDHTDYNEGFVLPLAIDRDCLIRVRPRDDGRVVLRSSDQVGEVEIAADGSTDPTKVDPPWGRYVAGVVSTTMTRADQWKKHWGCTGRGTPSLMRAAMESCRCSSAIDRDL